jgi:hypothetical protein
LLQLPPKEGTPKLYHASCHSTLGARKCTTRLTALSPTATDRLLFTSTAAFQKVKAWRLQTQLPKAPRTSIRTFNRDGRQCGACKGEERRPWPHNHRPFAVAQQFGFIIGSLAAADPQDELQSEPAFLSPLQLCGSHAGNTHIATHTATVPHATSITRPI